MDNKPQTVTVEEAQEALETLKTYAAERRPEAVASSYSEAIGRDNLPAALKEVETLLGAVSE